MAHHHKIPLHRNPKVRGIFFQAIAIIVFAWALIFIFINTIENLQARGIKTGIHFLDDVAPFAVPLNFFPFWDITLGKSLYWEIFVVGIQNTLLISILGIISATLLGFFIGILRLSPNWLLSRLASIYIEFFRNTPLLLQLLFWNFAVFLAVVPPPKASWAFIDSFFLNKAGFYMPLPVMTTLGEILAIGTICLFIISVIALRNWAKRRQDELGKTFPVAIASVFLLLTLLTATTMLSGNAITFEFSELRGFNYQGGMRLPLPAFVLWFGLTVYTAAFIAENVRGGILAISKGQTEAASALGLHHGQILKLVVIPQAMRVIIPPSISQFLNLTKNSSLAVAIGYPELVNVWSGIALNQTGQALIVIAMTIFVYETISLLTSAFLNYYNKKMQLQER